MIRRIPVAQSTDLSQTRGTKKTSIDSHAWDVPGGAQALGITGSKCPVHSTTQVENIRYHQLLPGPSFPTSLPSPPKPVLLKTSLLGKNGPQSTPSNHRWSTTPLSIASKKVGCRSVSCLSLSHPALEVPSQSFLTATPQHVHVWCPVFGIQGVKRNQATSPKSPSLRGSTELQDGPRPLGGFSCRGRQGGA